MKKNLSVRAISRLLACILLTLVALPAATRGAEQYLGAKAILQKVSESTGAPKTDDTAEAKLVKQLRADLEAFPQKAATLPPEAAARDWLALFDRLGKLPRASLQEDAGPDGSLSLSAVLAALPPPAAWDALAKAIEARPPVKGAKATRETGLHLLAHTLTGNRSAQTADMAALEAFIAKAGQQEGYYLWQTYEQLNEALMEFSDDTTGIMKSLDRQLARAESGESRQNLSVPNLVSLLGTNQAEEFLRRALRTPNVKLDISHGEETLRLARKLALELMPELKLPQWQLTTSLEATQLYEAMEKRFVKAETNEMSPTKSLSDFSHHHFESDYEQQGARAYYLLGLIVAPRTAEAVAFAQKMGKKGQISMPPEALALLERGGHGLALNDFFHDLLSQSPELPFWDEYVPIAARAGKADEMLALARTAAKREELTSRQRKIIEAQLYRALLAADKVEEGVAEIRRLLAAGSEDAEDESQTSRVPERAELGMMLARLGHLLERREWVEEGIQAARTALAASGKRDDYSARYHANALAGLLVELGRGPEAEAMLTEELCRLAHPQKSENSYMMSSENPGRELLVALAQLYYHAGRHADVVTLLDQASQWGAKDLVEIERQSGPLEIFHAPHGGGDGTMAFYAAAALAATGDKPEAVKLVNLVLDQDASFDPAYELLLQFGDTNTIAHLDAIYARDQFEERPLIWKAHLLRLAGKLEDAEAAARQAITVDPSDGEQGPGRRMRAYAELADIREARGDAKQAEFFRGAVQAIRLSEKADRFYEAGLLSRAVKMYEESLTHFADAYCIQSRLALRLAELGLHEAAEAHYRRAYELMPDSFGRVESHCFGCEGVFHGQQAQNLAEKVFGELVVKTPDKPQVHYLLGYLREEQGNYQAALPELRTAVKLDANYLNAWKHLLAVGERLRLPAAERDTVALNLLRLDPLGRHGYENVSRVSDLRALWAAVESAAKMRPVKPTSLRTLTASKLEMEKKPVDADQRREMMQMLRYRDYSEEGQNLTPGETIARQNTVVTIGQLINSSYMLGSFD